MNHISFSIIIPLYNKEECIAHTLQSVLKQTYGAYEVVVVDDGSTDRSCEVVSSFRDQRIRLVRKPNGGVSSARNFGISQSQYEYIAFLDADDWWDEKYLEQMQTLICQFPEAKMYGSSFVEVYGEEVRPIITNNCFPDNYVGYIDYLSVFSLHLLSPICSSAVVIEKTVFSDEIRFDERITSGEDLLVWLAIAFKYPVAYVNKALSFYKRGVEGSITTKLCPWTRYYVFYIKDKLNIDTTLKQSLVDGLILRFIRPYYSLKICEEETEMILNTVDFTLQPLIYRLYYKIPKSFVFYFYKILYSLRKKKDFLQR